MANEHFKALMRQGVIASKDPREVLKHIGGGEKAQQDSIRCPNCSNTLGIEKDISPDDFFKPGLGVYVTNADPILDGPEDVNENNGQVIVCLYCGYDVTEVVQNFYGTAKND
jgi:predicted nucleic-acid-binding Zn-ribbon protein